MSFYCLKLMISLKTLTQQANPSCETVKMVSLVSLFFKKNKKIIIHIKNKNIKQKNYEFKLTKLTGRYRLFL